MHHHQGVGIGFYGRYAQAAHWLGKPRFRQCHAILYQYLRNIEVGTRLERYRRAHGAGRCRLGTDIQHAFNAVDFLLDGGRDSFADGLGGGARVGRAYLDSRGCNFRKLANGKRFVGYGAYQQHQYPDNTGENRPADKEMGETHSVTPGERLLSDS